MNMNYVIIDISKESYSLYILRIYSHFAVLKNMQTQKEYVVFLIAILV